MPLNADELRVVSNTIRRIVAESGYGWAVTDQQCESWATQIESALTTFRAGVAGDRKPRLAAARSGQD